MPKMSFLYSRDGVLDQSSEAELSALLVRLEQQADPRLMLFVHGGLVSQQSGEWSAWAVQNRLGALHSEGWDTGYLIWRSGLQETLIINQDELANNSLFVRLVARLIRRLLPRVAKSGAAVAKSLDALDFSGSLELEDIERAMLALDSVEERQADEVRTELQERGELAWAENAEGLTSLKLSDDPFLEELSGDAAFIALASNAENQFLFDPEVRDEIAAAQALGLPSQAKSLQAFGLGGWIVALRVAAASWRVLNRFINGRDHGLGPTIVEELCRSLYLDQVGAAIWGLMKGDARQHFEPTGAAARLMQGLNAIAQSGKTVRVLLVGHSAGSIFTAKWAAEAAVLAPNVSTDHVMLAPAVRMDEAASLYGSAASSLSGMRIFTMNDGLEKLNHLDGTNFGKVYHRSLLYLISGVLERKGRSSYADAPLLGLERHHIPRGRMKQSEGAVLATIRGVLGAQTSGIVYSKSNGPDGRETGASTHGGYYADEATLRSILHIARSGFG